MGKHLVATQSGNALELWHGSKQISFTTFDTQAWRTQVQGRKTLDATLATSRTSTPQRPQTLPLITFGVTPARPPSSHRKREHLYLVQVGDISKLS